MKIWYLFRDKEWKQREMTKEETAYLDAWQKIKEWAYGLIKGEHGVEIEEPIEVRFKATCNSIKAFGVDADGKAYIREQISGMPYARCVDSPKGYAGGYGTLDTEIGMESVSTATLGLIRDVVDGWEDIREDFSQAYRKRVKLFSFEA